MRRKKIKPKHVEDIRIPPWIVRILWMLPQIRQAGMTG